MTDDDRGLRSRLERALPNHGEVIGLTRMRGGAKKDVRRVSYGDGFTCVLYAWDPSQNYLRTHPDGGKEGDREGALAYVRIHEHLHSLGARIPELYFMDATRSDYPFDLVMVEFLEGGTLEVLLNSDPSAPQRVMPGLRRMMDAMHADQRLAPSLPGSFESDPTGCACEDVMLNRGRVNVEHAASKLPVVAEQRGPLIELLDRLRSSVKPRAACGFIHGELGPDHVMMDSRGEPVLIDFDGAHYFDVELEHAFLEIRFRNSYEHLRAAGLDPDRLDFYRLCLDLSFTSGPLTLLEAGHPAREFIESIINERVGSMLARLRKG